MADLTLLNREGFDHLVDIAYRNVVIDQLRFSFHGLRYDYQHGNPVAPHIHDFFEFHYILAGKVKTRVNDVERTYFPGQYYIMTPLSIHSHSYCEPPNSTCESFALRWKLERVNSEQANPELDLAKYVLDRAPPLPIQDSNHTIAGMMNHIISCAEQKCSRTELLLLVARLIMMISQQCKGLQDSENPRKTLPDATPKILLSSVAFIEQHYAEPISASDVAANIPISYSHLARLFARHMKSSVNTYITRVRIDRASHLLMATDISIKSVSSEVGYASLSHFSNMFKKTMGQSPRDFRTRYRKRYFFGDPAALL